MRTRAEVDAIYEQEALLARERVTTIEDEEACIAAVSVVAYDENNEEQ